MTLCDIGNSSYHFLMNENDFKIDINDRLERTTICDPIYYISVNDNGERRFLQKFPNAINLKKDLHLDTQYANTLGTDRILACIGCSDGIIVDFGSAITVDIMEQQKHLGGFILPGLEKLKEIYPNISPKLQFEYKENISLITLPNDTNSAISFAINAMIVEPIRSLYHQHNLPLIITGEHGKKFLHYFENVMYEPKLIFKNMKLLIETTRNKK